MANMLFANNANTTLASSLTNVATTMSVTSASAFPSPTGDRKSTRLNSSHITRSRMPSSA